MTTKAGSFADAPQLEARELLMKEAATPTSREGKVTMINDVSRECSEAPAERDVCVELPENEFEVPDDSWDYVRYSENSFYGGIAAAANSSKKSKW